MNWQETATDCWTLHLGDGTVTLTVFKSRYNKENWDFAINDRQNSEPFKSLQGAKNAGLKLAIAQIEHTLRQLEACECMAPNATRGSVRLWLGINRCA